MANISFNSIYDGVSLALHATFPAPVQIHGGNVKQGLNPGDFNVLMPGAAHAEQLGRAERRPYVDVLYYPTDTGGTAECISIADQLTRVLGSITTPEGDIVHGSGMQWQIVDGVLHFPVTYTHFVRRGSAGYPMESLNIE